jgi:hypothetical protein
MADTARVRKQRRQQNRRRGKRSRTKRGAPRTAEQYFARTERFQDSWNRTAHVIAKMRADGLSLRKAAREVGISPTTVLRWGESALRKNRRGRFEAKRTDRLLRVLMMPASDGAREIAVRNSRQATLLAEYWTAVQTYLESGDAAGIERFKGNVITDASGSAVPLLTDLRELNRLGSAGILSFESLYSRSS